MDTLYIIELSQLGGHCSPLNIEGEPLYKSIPPPSLQIHILTSSPQNDFHNSAIWMLDYLLCWPRHVKPDELWPTKEDSLSYSLPLPFRPTKEDCLSSFI